MDLGVRTVAIEEREDHSSWALRGGGGGMLVYTSGMVVKSVLNLWDGRR